MANTKEEEELNPVSAAAVAAAIRRASSASPVEFTRRRFDEEAEKGGPLMPSSDFQRLCIEQLQLFRMVVSADAILSVSYLFIFFWCVWIVKGLTVPSELGCAPQECLRGREGEN